MPDTLHITNGDSAASLIFAGGHEGDILPWRDVLHEGPVPAGLDMRELSAVRARFIVERGWGDNAAIKAEFARRDQLLERFQNYRKVLLWFEHDLYDQLQILQILDWFSSQDPSGADIGLICTENYLGRQTPEKIAALRRFEEPVGAAHFDLAVAAWRAFRATSPKSWFRLLAADTDSLPFLHEAVLRMLEEYPDNTTGLSRTEAQALSLLEQSSRPAGQLFGENQKLEAAVYLGDSSYWHLLNRLLSGPCPLIEFAAGLAHKKEILPGNNSTSAPLQLTRTGREVLAGKANYLDLGWTPRWIGGVHLEPERCWCWNGKLRRIEARTCQ